MATDTPQVCSPVVEWPIWLFSLAVGCAAPVHSSFMAPAYNLGNFLRTALAMNVRHDSLVHLTAPLPSLVHCSGRAAFVVRKR